MTCAGQGAFLRPHRMAFLFCLHGFHFPGFTVTEIQGILVTDADRVDIGCARNYGCCVATT